MAIMDSFRSATADYSKPSPAAQPRRLTRLRALCVTRAVAAAVPELRHFARSTARRWDIPQDACDTLLLVVSELVTNTVIHSGSLDVTAVIVFDGVTMTVEVSDCGRWLVRDINRRVEQDRDAHFGRGLDLVRACTSRCTIHSRAAGTRVVVRFPVACGAGR
ncbi:MULTISPECIES: ATP-binding protein [Streptomyces violaceusniger group]|uniref:Histidine kinase/HSP90-like ATPase domain-containing protein n=2 Tax=Streptomyces rhizosphaericus TaxID=114699 RepID=A0ABP4BAX5_9ACTN|nr:MULTISPECIES: ATP-binding protein [Streptomyces violaceusniger group]